MYRIFEKYDEESHSNTRLIILGMQHAVTMFSATVLVPILTGMDISVCLFMAGTATLIFHFITQGKLPLFLGSSFSFIAAIIVVGQTFGLPYAQGGIFAAGFIFCIISALIYFFGAERIISFFPPIVTAPIIMIIGLILAPVAISSASDNWLLAGITFIAVTIISLYAKGFLKLLPVICGLLIGYIAALVTGNVDLTPIVNADWFGLPHFTIARFNIQAIIIVAPVALAVLVEHIGDIITISTITGKDFTKDPGLHKTILGDGIASMFSSFFGGVDTTTYSENTGVLTLTKVYNPAVMRIAACFAILLSLMPKIAAVVSTIPMAVIGGVSIILFGMIVATGCRTLVENQVDFKDSKNLIIMGSVLVFGLGGTVLPITIGLINIELSGVAFAAIIGIILNKILPMNKIEPLNHPQF